jgi:hypothetical protein
VSATVDILPQLLGSNFRPAEIDKNKKKHSSVLVWDKMLIWLPTLQ